MKLFVVGAFCERPRANTVRPYDVVKEIIYMKATGIVRRIDAGVIITPKPERPHKHWGFR